MVNNALSSIEDVIEDIKAGKMIILVDDEDRENEGDLVIAGDQVTPESINFMAKEGRGLVCLAMTKDRVDQLGLPLMAQRNSSRHQTAFTISIEAREGVTTGISAADRAQTVSVAIDPTKTSADIATPGHIFPLVAREGGVLVRAGHTEASVDLAKLAGLNPSGVICEIMNEDGTMARLPDLIPFAEKHGLKITTIRDLIEYRRQHDKLVEVVAEDTFSSKHGGEFDMRIYANKASYAEHVVLTKGDVSTGDPVMVRMHALNLFQDVLGDDTSSKGDDLQKSMEMIAKEGRGAIVIIREPLPTSVSDRLLMKKNKKQAPQLRDYGVGAQILLDLGISDMILLTNSEKHVIGLDGYGLKIVEQRKVS